MIVILLSVRETEKRYENVKRRRDYLILKKNYVYRTIDISPSGISRGRGEESEGG